ncbi:MAG TPA: nucleoside phosphorylase [Candidatus Bathyarchaeia archaeon]|nr:nucleoside phosphorylase [Candidatus Bathyarchaeia archaeon]
MSERFTARAAVEFWASQHGVSIDRLGLNPIVVGSWDLKTVKSLAKTVKAKPSPSWWWGPRFPLYDGEVGGRRVSFVNLPLGAPATVMVMEELIACGVRVFIGLGLAGSIQPEAPIGTCFIPTSCIREEGTSPHYLSSEEGLRPAQRLVRALEKARLKKGIVAYTGPIWTTDAPYRELVTTIEEYRLRNVLGVDMETSAMYAIGVYRNIEVCNLLVVSDELWRDWKPGFGRPELRNALKRAGEVVLEAITTLRT